MRVSCVLDEAVQKHSHLIALERVLTHNLEELIGTILKEEYFCLQWVSIQKLVPDLRKCLHHQIEDVSPTASCGLIIFSLVLCGHSCHWICLLETLGEETDQFTNIEHVFREDVYELGLAIIHLLEYVEDELISYVLETVLEIWHNPIVCLLEVFVLGITLAHLICENLANYINKDVFKSHLVAVFVLEASSASLIGAHGPDRLIRSLDVNLFHIANGWLLTE